MDSAGLKTGSTIKLIPHEHGIEMIPDIPTSALRGFLHGTVDTNIEREGH
jgi:hypothetical protein